MNTIDLVFVAICLNMVKENLKTLLCFGFFVFKSLHWIGFAVVSFYEYKTIENSCCQKPEASPRQH